MRPRAAARRDVESAVDYYASEAGPAIAVRFIAALELAWRNIADHPNAGSPRYSHELALPGLRCKRVKGYPWLVFYVERDDHVDVWRVLHAKRDIPASLLEPDR